MTSTRQVSWREKSCWNVRDWLHCFSGIKFTPVGFLFFVFDHRRWHVDHHVSSFRKWKTSVTASSSPCTSIAPPPSITYWPRYDDGPMPSRPKTSLCVSSRTRAGHTCFTMRATRSSRRGGGGGDIGGNIMKKSSRLERSLRKRDREQRRVTIVRHGDVDKEWGLALYV